MLKEDKVHEPEELAVTKSMTGVRPFDTVRLALMVVVQSALVPCKKGRNSRASRLDTILAKLDYHHY